MLYNIIVFLITRIFWLSALLIKEWGLFVGFVEQIIKLLMGIVSLTPTRDDDVLIEQVKELFNSIQGKIYNAAFKITLWYHNLFGKDK